MKPHLLVGVVMTALGVTSFGCSSTATGAKATSDAGTSDAGRGASAAALTCGGILDCVGNCADTDTACSDACVNNGSPDGKTKATALATCIQNAGCQAIDCVKANCAPQISSCLDASGGGGTAIPSGGAPATGSIPAGLQGEWLTSNLLYNFKPDGTVDRVNDVSTGGCHSTSIESGVGVVSGDTLSLYFTSGQFKICGSSSSDPYKAKQEDFTFAIDHGTGIRGEDELTLAKHTCQYTDSGSIALYCTDKLSRK